MENQDERRNMPPKPSRRTLRLTFRVTNGKFELVARENLEMITPPQVGERPEAGKHSGFWIELRDAERRVLAFRLVSPTQMNSVEVHSPDGKIDRAFGEVREGVFEVLLPDDNKARSVAVMGEPLVRPKRKTTKGAEKGAAKEEEISGEIAEFDLSGSAQGGE